MVLSHVGLARARQRLRPVVVLVAVLAAAVPSAHGVEVGQGVAECARVGSWLDPATGRRTEAPPLLATAARRAVVLLGESHDNAEDHRWQLHALAGLHAYRADLVLGFEMFPRSTQPVLERWVAGELDERAFLDAVRWDEVWGFDAELYLPLLHFARLNRVPMVALNVDRSLVARVAREGWDSVPEGEREGIGEPAAASAGYREFLARVMLAKSPPPPRTGADADTETASEEPPQEEREMLAQPRFERFVEAQLVWDRAMAEALATAHAGGALVVGIIGRGHLQHGYGVPRQLADLGVADVAVLLPFEPTDSCEAIEPGVATAAFVTDSPARVSPPRPPPRLGVMIEDAATAGARVREVVAESVAAAAGIRVDDLITAAAGREVRSAGDVVQTVRRQAPGTWLPLTVQRDGATLELLAKFPASGGPAE